MNSNLFFEGLNKQLVSFDIETYSPKGFPYTMEDPIVNFSLALPVFQNPRNGLIAFSVISHPQFEKKLLKLLYNLLSSFNGSSLLTYNGSKFDVQYVIHRGSLFNLDFEGVFSTFLHIDVYKLVKWLNIKLSSYSQRSVEKLVGFRRVVNDVSGASYHWFLTDFLKNANLKAPFYNIEDSVGCLQIMHRLFSVLKKENGQNYKLDIE